MRRKEVSEKKSPLKTLSSWCLTAKGNACDFNFAWYCSWLLEPMHAWGWFGGFDVDWHCLSRSPVGLRRGPAASDGRCVHGGQLLPGHRWPAHRPSAQAHSLLHLRPEAPAALLHRGTPGGETHTPTHPHSCGAFKQSQSYCQKYRLMSRVTDVGLQMFPIQSF